MNLQVNVGLDQVLTKIIKNMISHHNALLRLARFATIICPFAQEKTRLITSIESHQQVGRVLLNVCCERPVL